MLPQNIPFCPTASIILFRRQRCSKEVTHCTGQSDFAEVCWHFKRQKRTGAYHSSSISTSTFHTPRAMLQNPFAQKLPPSEEREVSSHGSAHLHSLTTAVCLILPGPKEPLIYLSWPTIIPLFKRLASPKCCSVALWKIQLVPENKVHLVQCLSAPPLTPTSNMHCYSVLSPHQLSQAWCAVHG